MTIEEKRKIVQIAIQESSKILLHTMIFIEAQNYIEGTVINEETGEAYRLEFKKLVRSETPKEIIEAFTQ